MGVLEEGQTIVSQKWKDDVTRRLDEQFEWIERHSQSFEAGNERFRQAEVRMGEIAEKVDTNTEITQRIDKNTAEILAIFAALRGFAKVSSWVGRGLRWIAALLAAAGLIYYTYKTGTLPQKGP